MTDYIADIVSSGVPAMGIFGFIISSYARVECCMYGSGTDDMRVIEINNVYGK